MANTIQDAELTTGLKPSRPTKARSKPAKAAALAYGVLSYRTSLTARECATIDRGLQILESTLRQPGQLMADPQAVKNYLCLQIGCETREVFSVLFLDVQNRLIAFEKMFNGTLTQTSVYPRDVTMACLKHGAAAAVIAHNHPSGSTQPSRADEALTYTLKTSLALVDVRLLDHIIVAGSQALSMAETGLL